jgi:YesN/AraC family two-component response regulator
MVVITLAVTSLVMSVSFQQILTDQIYTSQKDNLQNASYSIDYIYASVKTLALQLYFDRNISNLRNFESPEYEEINAVTSRLSMYGALIPYIQSIYIYSDIAKTFYVSIPYGAQKVYKSEAFYDKDILELLSSPSSGSVLYPISRVVPIQNANHEAVGKKGFTFLFYDLPKGDSVTEGAVVINVSEAWINNVIGKNDIKFSGRTFVKDSAGSIVADTGEPDIAIDQYDAACLEKIQSANNTEGYFLLDNGEGDKSLVIYSVYKPFGWILNRIIPVENIMGEVIAMRIKVLLWAMAILAIGCIIAVLISKRVYRPIDYILSKMSLLEKEVNNSMKTKKNAYLKELILGGDGPEYDYSRLSMKTLDLNIDPEESSLLLYIMIDHYKQFCTSYNRKDRDLFRFAVINIATELCSEHFKNDAVDMGEDHVVLILNIPDPAGEDLKGTLDALIKRIQESTRKAVTVQVSAVVSPAAKDISELSGSYDQARSVSYERFFSGQECILYCESVTKKNGTDYKYPAAREKKLVGALLEGNIDEAKGQYEEIIRECVDYSYHTFRLTALRLMSAICSVLSKMEENSGILFDQRFDKNVTDMEEMDSLEEVNRYFGELMERIYHQINEKKSNKYNELLEHIESIVEAEFRNSSLSLEVIASRVNMSPMYLGRLFKKFTTKSLVEYINEVRIKKAKLLLEETGKSVTDICEQTGYTNIQNFYRVFKRYTNVTPNEYRNNRS